jgi:hypothetical protein
MSRHEKPGRRTHTCSPHFLFPQSSGGRHPFLLSTPFPNKLTAPPLSRFNPLL